MMTKPMPSSFIWIAKGLTNNRSRITANKSSSNDKRRSFLADDETNLLLSYFLGLPSDCASCQEKECSLQQQWQPQVETSHVLGRQG